MQAVRKSREAAEIKYLVYQCELVFCKVSFSFSQLRNKVFLMKKLSSYTLFGVNYSVGRILRSI